MFHPKLGLDEAALFNHRDISPEESVHLSQHGDLSWKWFLLGRLPCFSPPRPPPLQDWCWTLTSPSL